MKVAMTVRSVHGLILLAILLGGGIGLAGPPRSQPKPSNVPPFQAVLFHECHDGDTCTITLAGIHPLFGERIPVRIAGVDAPERKGACERERALAASARDLLNATLRNASRIDLEDLRRDKYFRVLARVVADGQDVGSILIRAGLAVPYQGGTKTASWC